MNLEITVITNINTASFALRLDIQSKFRWNLFLQAFDLGPWTNSVFLNLNADLTKLVKIQMK
jgi:hypothetical protein